MSLDPTTANLINRINVGDSLTRSAARDPGALALSDGHRRLTYAEFNTQVNLFAHALTARGVTVGDAVALASRNSIEFLVTYYACAKLGAVCVPVNLDWRIDEVRYLLDDSAAKVLVVQGELAETTAAAARDAVALELAVVVGTHDADFGRTPVTPFTAMLDHDDTSEPEHLVEDRSPLTYLYTSGTTSAPKGVVGNHAAVYLESMSMIIEGRFRADDRFAAMLPMFHTAQLNCHCTSAIMIGAAVHILPGFDADRLLTLIETEGITQLFGLPTMYRAMLEHDSIGRRDLTTLRRALYAMAPMPQTMLERCIDVFDCEFYLLFGQTEMSPTATIFRPENQLTHPGAVGTPAVNVQVGIMDEEGRLLERGGTGEIVYRGPHVMTGYHGRPAATEESFRGGWFHSGDIGHFDDDGILWFTDRNKDVIKSGGENVSSLEVEKALYSAEPGAAEVVVVGLPHDHWSEAITAFVVPRPGTSLDPQTIRTNMRAHIDAYKIPKAVVIVDTLPKTATGKFRKNVVRKEHLGLYGSS